MAAHSLYLVTCWHLLRKYLATYASKSHVCRTVHKELLSAHRLHRPEWYKVFREALPLLGYILVHPHWHVLLPCCITLSPGLPVWYALPQTADKDIDTTINTDTRHRLNLGGSSSSSSSDRFFFSNLGTIGHNGVSREQCTTSCGLESYAWSLC